MIKTKHFYDLNTQSDKLKDKQTIVGFTCMETDRIMVLRNEREMQVGDQIIFKKVGAYTMSLNPLFIQYFPRVYVFDGDSYAPVRDQWAIDEFLQKNVWWIIRYRQLSATTNAYSHAKYSSQGSTLNWKKTYGYGTIMQPIWRLTRVEDIIGLQKI